MTRAFKSERHVALNNTFPREGADLLLASGAVEGPARKTRPFTLTTWMRLRRWVRSWSTR